MMVTCVQADVKAAVTQDWAAETPSEYDNVWVPAWKVVAVDVSPPRLWRLYIEGKVYFQDTMDITLDAVYIEIHGGALRVGGAYGESGVDLGIAPFTHKATITLHGDRFTPAMHVGIAAIPITAKTIGVFGKLDLTGLPRSHSWTRLAATAKAGDTSIVVVAGADLDWGTGDRLVLSPTGFEQWEAEEVTIVDGYYEDNTFTFKIADPGVRFDHVVGGVERYGSRSITMNCEVGLLTRNVVVRGADGRCEPDENSRCVTSPLSRRAWKRACSAGAGGNGCEFASLSEQELGVRIVVARYSEREVSIAIIAPPRHYAGEATLSNVQMKDYGQLGYDWSSGIGFYNAFQDSELRGGVGRQALRERYQERTAQYVRNCSFDYGHGEGIRVANTSYLELSHNVFYRTIGRGLAKSVWTPHTRGGDPGGAAIGSDAFSNGLEIHHNLAVLAIYAGTHRETREIYQEFYVMASFALLGRNFVTGNVAVGSERAGFRGK
jgi:hypothetical protein